MGPDPLPVRFATYPQGMKILSRKVHHLGKRSAARTGGIVSGVILILFIFIIFCLLAWRDKKKKQRRHELNSALSAATNAANSAAANSAIAANNPHPAMPVQYVMEPMQPPAHYPPGQYPAQASGQYPPGQYPVQVGHPSGTFMPVQEPQATYAAPTPWGYGK